MKKLQITIQLPQDLPAEDEGLRQARRAALEGAVIKLWEAGHLSTRTAARRLGLSYHDYLDLLHSRGVPVLRQTPREEVVQELVEQVRARGRHRE